ncbi:MAG TPA: hypothetical protein VKO62_04475, partial [Solirubrobacterales bacterium]|nr:hypothetical protein [Solirubrobacterales bacterium]
MSNRFAAGFTIAGFPLTGAMLAVTAGNFILAAILMVPFVAICAATVAPRVRRLHQLPLVGAPRLTVGFRANGSVEFEGEEPREVSLEAPAD